MSNFAKVAKQIRFLQQKYLDPKADKMIIASDLRKIAVEIESEEEDSPEFKEYRNLLNKLKNKESIQKLKIFLDNPRLRKPIRWWLISLDKGEGAGAVDFMDMVRKFKLMLQRDLPAARFLKMILDYGVANGYIALDRMLSKNRARMVMMKEDVTASKIAQAVEAIDVSVAEDDEESPEFKEYRNMLNRMKNKESIQKLKVFIDNPRLRKPIRWWLINLDKGEGAGAMDFMDMIRKMKLMLQRDLPAARWLKLVLDYGIANGYIALDRILSKNRARMTLMKEEGVA